MRVLRSILSNRKALELLGLSTQAAYSVVVGLPPITGPHYKKGTMVRIAAEKGTWSRLAKKGDIGVVQSIAQASHLEKSPEDDLYILSMNGKITYVKYPDLLPAQGEDDGAVPLM